MASIGHVAVGLLIGRCHPARSARERWALLAAGGGLALLPDGDVLGLALGLADRGPYGHRGLTHSLTFALVGAVALYLIGRRRWPQPATSATLAFMALASHGVLDALTYGSRGIPFFWPLDETRWKLPWRMIPPAPTGLDYLGRHGLGATAIELLYFAPVLLLALVPWPRLATVGREKLERVRAWLPLRVGLAVLVTTLSLATAHLYLGDSRLVAWIHRTTGTSLAAGSLAPPPGRR